jgi:hypothetical protein
MGSRPLVAFGNEPYELNLTNYNYKYDNYTRNVVSRSFGGCLRSPLLSGCSVIKWKALRMIVDAPWYLPNTVIWRDLQTLTVKEEICRYSSQYRARLSAHPGGLIANLMDLQDNRRLRRHLPNDLPNTYIYIYYSIYIYILFFSFCLRL